MLIKKYSRRDFLKYSALGLTSLAFRPYFTEEVDLLADDIGRVATKQVSVYKEPTDKSEIRYQRFRDDLLHIYYETISEDGPAHNPLWYRVWGGYVHSARVVRVKADLNPVLSEIKEVGQPAEVTVPYSQSYMFNRINGWIPMYRLYYGSNHWITRVEEGPDGEAWYCILDDLLNVEYFVPAQHLRPITPEELSPISPDVPLGGKKIEISISLQTLKAYENGEIVLDTTISSGLISRNLNPGNLPTDTPRGTFAVQSKMPSKHMGDGHLTSDIEAYELPGVPWVSFFEPTTGIACHGTYWHNNFGVRMSHGCINMRNEEAKWLYRWTSPILEEDKWHNTGYGTRVIVE